MVECLPELVEAAEGSGSSSSSSSQASAAAEGAAAQKAQRRPAALPHRARELLRFAMDLINTAVQVTSDVAKRQLRSEPFIPGVLQQACLPGSCAAALRLMGGWPPPPSWCRRQRLPPLAPAAAADAGCCSNIHQSPCCRPAASHTR
jgi:hypothetical protein